MTSLRLTNFGGIIPRLGRRNLPDTAAQFALNAKLLSGELRAWWRGAQVATTPPGTVDFYPLMDGGVRRIIPFENVTEVAKAPLINDSFGRLYFTDETGAYVNTKTRLIAGDPAYALGVPAPSTPSATISTSGGTGLVETRVYTVTLVSAFGEEGPNGVLLTDSGAVDGTWNISGLNSVTYDTVKYTNIAKLRLYRTITSATGVDYRVVTEFDIDSVPSSYDDTVPATTVAVAPVLESFLWEPPPAGLRGLIAVANGFLAGFVGRTLYLSHPYYPHAWPTDYQLAVEDDIVALGHFGNVIVITTTGQPYAAIGVDPTQMSLSQYNTALPCISARGLVSTAGAVLYPSPDGLVTISDAGINIATRELCSRDDWDGRFGVAGMISAVYSDRYMSFYGSTLGFVLGFGDPATAFTELQYNRGVVSMHTDRETGDVLILSPDLTVAAWDRTVGNALAYTWRSKPFLLPKPTNMAALQVRGDFLTPIEVTPTPGSAPSGWSLNAKQVNQGRINGSNPEANNSADAREVSVKVYADDELVFARNVVSEAPVRMQSGYKAVKFEIELSGFVPVYSAVIASTMKELEAVQ